MKMFAAGCVVAVLATVAVQFASSATSKGSVSIPRRVRTLEAKVKTLRAGVKVLQTRVAALKVTQGCLGVRAITESGAPPSAGYYYSSNGVSFTFASALHVTQNAETPTFYTATVNASCIGGATNSAFRGR